MSDLTASIASGEPTTSVGPDAWGEPTALHPAMAKPPGHKAGWLRLFGCAIAIVALWGWLLPAIGSRNDVRASIQRMDALGINPAAIFYTDVFQSPAPSSATEFSDKR